MSEFISFYEDDKKEIKKLNIKEFRENGYLQELNRQFLHPLGLALEIIIDDDDNEILGGIWDYRNDEEGILYDIKNSDSFRINTFKQKEKFIKDELEKRSILRKDKLGFIIEPIL
jgi:hypothetical protein